MRLGLSALILLGLCGCSSAGGTQRSVNPPDTSGGTGGDDQGGSGSGGHGQGGTAGDQGGAGGTKMVDAAPAEDVAPDDLPPDSGPPEDHAVDLAAATDVAVDAKPAADRPSNVDVAPVDTHYNPCPPKGQACVVLPLGDSLTAGAYSSTGAGYRGPLFREAVTHNQLVTFVGSAASGPTMFAGTTVPFPRHHEGHGGYTIEGISTWLTTNNTLATFKPDIVLLHIGTNNGLRHPGPNIPNVLKLLGGLIDQIVAADPHALVIVAQIIPSKSDDGVKNTQAYDDGIPAVVAARASAGKHVIIADLHTPFVADANWKTDYLPTSDVHPIDAGYDVMGKAWYTVLGPLLR